jgi:hypothetical protein
MLYYPSRLQRFQLKASFLWKFEGPCSSDQSDVSSEATTIPDPVIDYFQNSREIGPEHHLQRILFES